MSLVAQKITADALKDMIEMFEAQPWLTDLHEEMTELWNMCGTRDEQVLLKSLLLNFCLLDRNKELQACQGINEKIRFWGLVPENTWIVAVANKSEIDGSTAGLQKLKNKVEPAESWHFRMLPSIPEVISKVKAGDTVLLFDDFIGSGSKMLRKKVWLSTLLQREGIVNVDVGFIGFAGMRFGLQQIIDADNGKVFVQHILLKGISERYPPPEAIKMTALMLQLEARLGATYKHKKIADYSLGYGKSEALYCGQNDNCPNNVFPILWWPALKTGKYIKTILRRVG